MVYEPQDHDLYCRHSRKKISVISFSLVIIVFGMISMLMMIIVLSLDTRLDYRLSTLAINLILVLAGVCSIAVGYLHYQNKKSEFLFFTDPGVYLRKSGVFCFENGKFNPTDPSTKPGTLFAEQMVAKTFLYNGHPKSFVKIW